MKTKKVSLHLNNGNSLNHKGHLGSKGFSLIELIVVIAIMIVLTGVAFASSSMMNSSYVKEVEQGIEDYVTMARTKSMSVSAKDWYMEVTMEDGEYVTKLCKTEEEVVEGAVQTTTRDIDKDIYNGKVTVSFDDGTGYREISDIMPLCIYFDSATGRVRKVTVGGVNADITNGIGRIEIVCGNYDVVMKFFYNTGKVERE